MSTTAFFVEIKGDFEVMFKNPRPEGDLNGFFYLKSIEWNDDDYPRVIARSSPADEINDDDVQVDFWEDGLEFRWNPLDEDGRAFSVSFNGTVMIEAFNAPEDWFPADDELSDVCFVFRQDGESPLEPYAHYAFLGGLIGGVIEAVQDESGDWTMPDED